jgi:hypothetical protein
MAVLYKDSRITCDEDGITIKRYYFPFGNKRILYDEIRGVVRHKIGPLTGQYRFWGMGPDFKYWFSEDHGRMRKTVGFNVDKGGRFRAVLTPDDPDAAAAVLSRKLGERYRDESERDLMFD